MARISKAEAEAQLRAFRCKPAPDGKVANGHWWENEWGFRFFLQHLPPNDNVDREMLSRILQDIMQLRNVRNR